MSLEPDNESSPYDVRTRYLSNHPYLETRHKLNKRDTDLLRDFESGIQEYLALKFRETKEDIMAENPRDVALRDAAIRERSIVVVAKHIFSYI